ncbi:hypothetical protein PUT78_03655 [Roseinatronobacter sp. HJB301]|uniref:Uncharacterized protein n=1 Tax=Roseinatronobacter alkalisoli TaxID=3028235 RepID=A0ABT5T715_9RHOB|nr:hypothetical protein [Roseinatronobacter sp. HJB301]
MKLHPVSQFFSQQIVANNWLMHPRTKKQQFFALAPKNSETTLSGIPNPAIAATGQAPTGGSGTMTG